MNWLSRWLRIRILRAELADIDREEQHAKNAIANAWLKRAERLREIAELEAA